MSEEDVHTPLMQPIGSAWEVGEGGGGTCSDYVNVLGLVLFLAFERGTYMPMVHAYCVPHLIAAYAFPFLPIHHRSILSCTIYAQATEHRLRHSPTLGTNFTPWQASLGFCGSGDEFPCHCLPMLLLA